jgi:hypothetical protein
VFIGEYPEKSLEIQLRHQRKGDIDVSFSGCRKILSEAWALVRC